MTSIIDTHVHLSERGSDQLIRYAKLNGLDYTLEEYLGIMKMLHIESGLLISAPQENWEPMPNEDVIKLCQLSKWKLLPILTIGHSSSSVSKALDLASEPANRVRAFKILLGYKQICADDRVYNRIYDYAESRELPVLFHTGDTATRDGSLEHAHPLALDRLANSRPHLKIIACHFGNPWIEDVAELIYKHENVFADISGLFAGGGEYASEYLSAICRKLSEAIYYIGNARKIVFGSDYPVSTPANILKLVNHLQITQKDKVKILCANAKELFKL